MVHMVKMADQSEGGMPRLKAFIDEVGPWGPLQP
jgi:hypothetical protein